MHPPPRPANRLEKWQRALLVSLGTLVVIMAATAVALLIRNALGSSGLTGGPVAPETTITSGITTVTATTSPGERPGPIQPTTTPVPETSLPETTLPPATFVEQPIVASDLYLQPEGLGPLPFGTDVQRTLQVLTGALGNPDNDTGWVPADLGFLKCPGIRARVVTWGSLTVFFSDGPTDWGPDGHEHLFSFAYSLPEGSSSPAGPELRTSEGLKLGAVLSRASSIYGEASITTDHPAEGTILEVDVPGPGYLRGIFSGSEPEDTLISVSGGIGCEQ